MALRTLREKKPAWFQNKFTYEIINYSLGIYYGLFGIYFIFRGLPGTDSGIYTDMLLNILYEPIVIVENTQIFGYESLTRLQTNHWNAISDFIQEAEQEGLQKEFELLTHFKMPLNAFTNTTIPHYLSIFPTILF